MGGIDFVVPIGADQQQVPHLRLGQEILEQIERRRVRPLQIIEEQRKRMFGAREHAKETPKHQLEPPLRLLWRKFGNWRLFSNDELYFRDEVDDELAVRPQHLAQGVTPVAQLGVALD